MRKRNRRSLFMVLTMIIMLMTFMVACGVSEEDVSNVAPVSREDSSLVLGRAEEARTRNVVLVMDESSSMETSDKHRIAIEGAKLYIDMEKLSGVNGALVRYSNSTDTQGMKSLEDMDERINIKREMDAIDYENGGQTDTGLGLLKAVELLDEAADSDDKIIILFTDGQTYVSTDTRMTEDSQADMVTAVQHAKEKGYIIYAIGLNADGSVNKEELKTLVDNHLERLKITTDVNELPEFFNSIFAEVNSADQIELDDYEADGDFHDVPFTIDNEIVMEANIVILSQRKVSEIQLTDPEGNEISLEGNDKVIFTPSETYSLVKLIYPQPSGEWHVRVKGVQGDRIEIGLIYNYNVNMIVEAERTRVIKGEESAVTASLYVGDSKLEEDAVLQELKGYVTAVNVETGKKMPEVNMMLDAENNLLRANCVYDECGIYNVSVHVEGPGFYRDSDIFSVTVYKDPVQIVQEIGKIKLWTGKMSTWDLNEYFVDVDGDEIEYSVDINNSSLITADTDDNGILTVAAHKKGTANIIVYADNGSNVKTWQTVEVICRDRRGLILLLVIAWVAVVGIILLILLTARSKRQLMGTFYDISIENNDKDADGNMLLVSYPINNYIKLSAMGKHSFNLDKLLKLIERFYASSQYDQEKKSVFHKCIYDACPEAKRIKIVGSKKEYTFMIQMNGSKAKLIHNNRPDSAREKEISLNQSISGSLINNGKISIRFERNDADGYVQLNMTYKK
ncbi:MAG: VWA domain-containing protein [Lachnospiraceae bacterium]|nr:VWA domain-containing protein [Lachnospiraceae bacterium]